GVLIGVDGGTMADCRVTDCSNNGNWRVHGTVKMTGGGHKRYFHNGNKALKVLLSFLSPSPKSSYQYYISSKKSNVPMVKESKTKQTI
ncbi:MAG: hypothetical protein IIU37_04045, partial [Erysipelotrichaceae bacterium]|nr:hypothetical protein [Erysipelotrichaceae bacterium]